MIKRSLGKIQSDYERILHSDGKYKDIHLATLMTEMERTYGIPTIRNESWEKQNKAVIALYRKISLSRNL